MAEEKEMSLRNSILAREDPEVFRAVELELKRERDKIDLIASENLAPPAVLAAQGSILTNKYAEGYPGHRYYPGCEPVDLAESLAIERAVRLFGCDHANVQPHSGSQANMAAYISGLEPGGTILAMDLTCGGHLTHGERFNFSGLYYGIAHYGLDRDTGLIDYEEVMCVAEDVLPGIIVAGASSYSRALDFEAFRRIADSVGARLMVDMAHFGGLVAGRAHPDPVPYADFVTGTTHKTLRGPRGGFVLCREEYRELLDRAVFPGTQGGPCMHVIAAKAVCFREAMKPEFREYQEAIVGNARTLCRRMQSLGYEIVSGGTDTHLFVIDLRPTGITGREGQDLLDAVNIDANRNVIPYDEQPAAVTSGIRIGTPSVTTRGMGPGEMEILGGLIARALESRGDSVVLARVREEVLELAAGFPVYPELG